MIEMSESREDRAARREVQTAGQIDVTLGPEGRELIRRLVRSMHSYVGDFYAGEVQLKSREQIKWAISWANGLSRSLSIFLSQG